MDTSDMNIIPQVNTSPTESNLTVDSYRVKAPVVGAGFTDFGEANRTIHQRHLTRPTTQMPTIKRRCSTGWESKSGSFMTLS